MSTYTQLTKKLTDENNNQMVVCSQHGTEKCHIHTPSGCTNCPVFQAILRQLNAFEEVYMEVVNEK